MGQFTPLGRPIFDAWSMAHLGFWFLAASTLWAFFRGRYRLLLAVICVFGAFSWELFEVFAEKAWPRLWTFPESDLNRWLGDPLTCVLGILVMWFCLDASARRS